MNKKAIIIAAALLAAGGIGTGVALAGCEKQDASTETSSVSSPAVKSEGNTESTAPEETVSNADTEVSQASSESETGDVSQPSDTSVSESTAESSEESKKASSKDESSKNQSSTANSSKPDNSRKTSTVAQTSKPSQTSQTSKSSQTSQTSKPSQTSQTSTPKPTPKPTVTFKNMSVNGVSSMTEGDTVTASATVYMSDGSTRTSGISWSSSNTGVVSVSSGGTLSARSAGSATITATYDNHQASFTVSVSAKPQQQSTQPSGSAWYSSFKSHKSYKFDRLYYEWYDMLAVVNKARRENGLNELVWDTPQAEYDYAYKYGQYLKSISEISPEITEYSPWIFENIESGNSYNFNPDYTPRDEIWRNIDPEQFVRPNIRDLDYMVETNTCDHGPGGCQIVGTVGGNDPEHFLNTMRTTFPGHWAYLMSEKATTLMVLIDPNPDMSANITIAVSSPEVTPY